MRQSTVTGISGERKSEGLVNNAEHWFHSVYMLALPGKLCRTQISTQIESNTMMTQNLNSSHTKFPSNETGKLKLLFRRNPETSLNTSDDCSEHHLHLPLWPCVQLLLFVVAPLYILGFFVGTAIKFPNP